MKKLSKINKQFIKAAKNNQIDALKNLLSQGADIHTEDDYALKLSVCYGHLESVKLLVAQGANIHAEDDYALRQSATKGYLEVVKFLFAQGANIHADDDYALRYSALNGYLETVKLLITHGANIHAKDDDALRSSASWGHLETVKFLITQGANIHSNNDEALKESAQNGHDDVWQVLSAFIQEEKLLVAALGVTSASTWISGMPVLPALGSVALVAASDAILTPPQKITSVDASHPQRLSMAKTKRSKI